MTRLIKVFSGIVALIVAAILLFLGIQGVPIPKEKVEIELPLAKVPDAKV